MPTLRRNGAHRPVAAKLAEAREIFQPLEPTSGSAWLLLLDLADNHG